MDLRDRLSEELGRRVQGNPRYSLRAFARSLSLHHSTLRRVLDGSRGLSPSLLHRVCTRLGYSPAEIRAAKLVEDARRVLRVASAPGFRPDCRWIAMQSGVDLDNVNRALHLRIHERRLVMSSANQWTVTP
jgi:plasmid maintenance system antidote protein VapI